MPRTPYSSDKHTPMVMLPRNVIQTNGLPVASPGGWVDPSLSQLGGNNVRLPPAPVVAAETVDVQGAPTRAFNIPIDFDHPKSHDSLRAARTHVFFTANLYHDRLYLLGFDEKAGAYQAVNYSGEGQAGDALNISVQVSGNDAYFTPATADGMCCPLVAMGIFTGPDPDRDSAFEQLIVIHELTHSLSQRLVGGPTISASMARRTRVGWARDIATGTGCAGFRT